MIAILVIVAMIALFWWGVGEERLRDGTWPGSNWGMGYGGGAWPWDDVGFSNARLARRDR